MLPLKRAHNMKFDTILLEIGVFGKFQKVLCLLLSLFAVPSAWHAIGQVFLAAKTDFWCAAPADQILNCSNSEFDQNSEEDCLELQKQLTIPSTIDEDGNIVYSECERYVYAQSPDLDESSLNSTFGRDPTETTSCDARLEYDRSQYKTTLIQDVMYFFI